MADMETAVLTQEQMDQAVRDLNRAPITQSGGWGPLGWDVGLLLDVKNLTSSGASARITVFDVEILNASLDAEHPKAAVNLTAAGVGVQGELGMDFGKRQVRLKGSLKLLLHTQPFDLVLVSF